MNNNLIYDVGMFDGADTQHYLSKGYNVIAVEADPTLAEKAKVKFRKYLKNGRLIIVNMGIAENSGVSYFYINDLMPHWNSFHEEITSRDNLPYRKIEIPCVRFEDILLKYGVPYYLKIDIEGNDMLCLKSLNKKDLPKFISFEADNQGDSQMLEILKDLGYKKFQCINQNNFLPITIPYKSSINRSDMKLNDRIFLKIMYGKNLAFKIIRKLNGRSIFRFILSPSSHLTYPISTSGPFGEYLPYKWHSYDEIKDQYLRSYESFNDKNPNLKYGFWCDFHASL